MFTPSKTDTWIGLNIQGDVGPYTMYTSIRGQIVAFPRVPPLSPPSPSQEAIREYFRQAAREWRALTAEERAGWAKLAQACNLGITGYNLWTHYVRAPNYDSLVVLERRAGFSVTRPPAIEADEE